jgi:hypothetical protein
MGQASLGLASASATGTKQWTIGTSQQTEGVSLLLQPPAATAPWFDMASSIYDPRSGPLEPIAY